MARKIIQLYRGTTAQNDAFTGAAGEVTVDTDTHELRVHDGSTAGGFAVAKKSAIPTVNNATLTIQKNGTTVNTFTANASSNVTANITVPTKISDLTNDSNFANTDLSNLTSTGKNLCNWSTNVSNCITEIPQDINLTLSNGTLTLKSGSKVYVPNGAGVFDTVTIASDLTLTLGTDGRHFVAATIAGTSITGRAVSACVSGAGVTAVRAFAYDTTTNKINNYNSGGTIGAQYSFPVAIVTVSSGAISSIDQVFNGFGYIGSTVFALPDVKYLCPDGRNTDGTLKNTSATVQNVITKTIPTNLGWHYFVLNPLGTGGDLATEFYVGVERPSNPTTYSRYYNPAENRMYTVVSGAYTAGTLAVISIRIEHNSNSPYAITSWNSPTVFHAVDYSDWNEHRVVAFQAPTSANNYTWYRKYSDGWVEQGGKSASRDETIVLPVAMSDANYIINTDVIGTIQWAAYGHSINTVTTTGFKCYYDGDQTDPTGFYWEVKGIAA